MILSLIGSGAEVSATSGVSGKPVSHTTRPVSLLVAMMRGGSLGRSDDEIAQQRGAAIAVLLLLAGVHAPDDAAGVAGGGVDLVEHARRIRDVDEAVLGERGRLHELIGGDAAQRHRVEELQILDVRLVDLVERRIALAVIGAVVHQPVLRLRIGEPLRRHVCRERRTRNHGAGQEHSPYRTVVSHRVPPMKILFVGGRLHRQLLRRKGDPFRATRRDGRPRRSRRRCHAADRESRPGSTADLTGSADAVTG